jgi:FAD/FMN-containing dehydrogenase
MPWKSICPPTTPSAVAAADRKNPDGAADIILGAAAGAVGGDVAEAIELAWHVREGLLGLVGKNRPEGSTLITEDVCFPPERLAGSHRRKG